VKTARWILAFPVSVVSGLILGTLCASFELKTDSLANMIRAASTQCFVTPFLVLVILAVVIPPKTLSFLQKRCHSSKNVVIPPKSEAAGISAIILVAFIEAVCVIPACVVAMLHAGLPANYLSGTSGFYLAGILAGALLAILYVLTIKSRCASKVN
jgi:ABC-type dipeptide/oligopeptide/nickel transport system permease subunit